MATFLNQAKSHKGMPIGTIIPWCAGTNTIPSGWLPCSGSVTYDISKYPALYEVIGNTYGGTEGDSFKLPKLNDGSSGAMDVFRGHFYYLQDKGEAHAPEKTLLSDDLFWKNIGGSFDGNGPNTVQTNYVSQFDIVGEIENVNPQNPNEELELVARFDSLEFNDGEYTSVLVPAERKLSDRHVPSHNHGYELSNNNGSTNYTLSNPSPIRYAREYFDDGVCYISGSRATVARALPPNILGNNMRNNIVSASQGNTRIGGGNFNSCSGGDLAALCYTVGNADGYTGGDMWSHRNGRQYFWSNIQPSTDRAFTGCVPHSHGAIEIEFSTRFINILSPGLVNDVRLNTVQINNATGLNFGTITFNTATPTLSMVFIIKAF